MRTRLRRSAAALAGGGALVGLAALVATPAAESQGDPPGNNGTVKINGEDVDDIPNNQPHVGCQFLVEFYGYDEGDLQAEVTFEGIPPTGGGTLLTDTVDIGEDPAGGGTDLDAAATYDLTEALAGIEPHPQQGHHIRLTVEADGSIGNNTKSKVFWVEDCQEPPNGTTTTTGDTTTTTTGDTTTTTGDTTTTTTGPDDTTTTTAPTTTTVPDGGGNGDGGGTSPAAPPVAGAPTLTG